MGFGKLLEFCFYIQLMDLINKIVDRLIDNENYCYLYYTHAYKIDALSLHKQESTQTLTCSDREQDVQCTVFIHVCE